MNMIYLRNKRIIVFFLAIFLFFVFEGTISLDAVFFKMFYRFFPERKEGNIAQEILVLYQKISDLEQKLSQKEGLDKEIFANMVFGGGYIFSDSIFLDKGLEDGVEIGDFVVYKSSFAVAKIEEVFPKYSKASPFTRFAQEISLRSGPEMSILFKAEGGGGRGMFAFLPKGSGINLGDGVYIAEAPRFLAGFVETAEKKESRDFEKINIVVPFSLRSIVEVGVVKNNVKK